MSIYLELCVHIDIMYGQCSCHKHVNHGSCCSFGLEGAQAVQPLEGPVTARVDCKSLEVPGPHKFVKQCFLQVLEALGHCFT